MATVDDLLAALDAIEGGQAPTKATSVRMPAPLRRAVALAVELGMDASFTDATANALAERVRGFVRQRALAEHFTAFPADVPSLAAVANRRVAGTSHPGAERPGLIDAAAARVERRHPDWAVTGDVDRAVDQVLDLAAILSDDAQRPARSASAG